VAIHRHEAPGPRLDERTSLQKKDSSAEVAIATRKICSGLGQLDDLEALPKRGNPGAYHTRFLRTRLTNYIATRYYLRSTELLHP